MKNRSSAVKLAGLIALASIALVACTTPPARGQDTEPPVTSGPVTVENIEILILESLPAQVIVHVRGYLPDPCTVIDMIVQEHIDDRFEVEIVTTRDPEAMCIQVIEPFEVTISLDVEGLPAGTYTVDVNGVTGTFTFSIDNVLDG